MSLKMLKKTVFSVCAWAVLFTGTASADNEPIEFRKLQYQSGRFGGVILYDPAQPMATRQGSRFWRRAQRFAEAAADEREFGVIPDAILKFPEGSRQASDGIRNCDAVEFSLGMQKIQEAIAMLNTEREQEMRRLYNMRGEHMLNVDKIRLMAEDAEQAIGTGIVQQGGESLLGAVLEMPKHGARITPGVNIVLVANDVIELAAAIGDAYEMSILVSATIAQKELIAYYEVAVIPRYDFWLGLMENTFNQYRDQFSEKMCRRDYCEQVVRNAREAERRQNPERYQERYDTPTPATAQPQTASPETPRQNPTSR